MQAVRHAKCRLYFDFSQTFAKIAVVFLLEILWDDLLV